MVIFRKISYIRFLGYQPVVHRNRRENGRDMTERTNAFRQVHLCHYSLDSSQCWVRIGQRTNNNVNPSYDCITVLIRWSLWQFIYAMFVIPTMRRGVDNWLSYYCKFQPGFTELSVNTFTYLDETDQRSITQHDVKRPDPSTTNWVVLMDQYRLNRKHLKLKWLDAM